MHPVEIDLLVTNMVVQIDMVLQIGIVAQRGMAIQSVTLKMAMEKTRAMIVILPPEGAETGTEVGGQSVIWERATGTGQVLMIALIGEGDARHLTATKHSMSVLSVTNILNVLYMLGAPFLAWSVYVG